MIESELVDVLRRVGLGRDDLREAPILWARLDLLQQTGRYGRLLAQLQQVNDKANLDSQILEANFAYQFESKGSELVYEVKQDTRQGSSIDFRRVVPAVGNVFFELRLIQQASEVTQDIADQLARFGEYRLLKNGSFDQAEIIRIQGIILGKIQDSDGIPTKFFSRAADTINIVTVDTTQAILGMIDVYDCLLAAHGDVGVPEHCRRGVFGLFQDDRPEYPDRIHKLAEKFAHARGTLHGLLFLFKEPNSGHIAYRLRQCMVWNPALIASDRAKPVFLDLCRAIPIHTNGG